MNKHIDLSVLSEMLATKKRIDPKVAELFVQQFFNGIETELITDSSVKIEELGTFKIIKSGSLNRILFLGTTGKAGAAKSGFEPIAPSTIPKVNNITPTLTDRKPTATAERDYIGRSIDKTEVTVSSTTERISAIRNLEEVPTTEESTEKPETAAAAPSQRLERDDPRPAAIKAFEKRKKNQKDPNGYISEREDFPSEEDYNNSPMKSKSFLYRILFPPLALAITGILVYLLFSETTGKSKSNTEYTTSHFTELENNDSKSYSCIIVTDTDISLKYLAKAYYGNEAFWPYIYKVNENIVNDKYIIQAKSIIKIPKIVVDLVSFNRGELDEKAKKLAEEISKTTKK